MELRRLSICLAFFVLAVISQCSEARHSIQRRAADYSLEDNMFNDGAEEDGAQNDGNDVDEDAEPEPVMITSRPENYRLIIGRTVRLECKLAPSDAFAVVSWTKGGTEKLFLGTTALNSVRNKYMLDKPTHDLIIKDLNFNDTGRYTCQVEQTKPVSITHSVIVQEPPMISSFTVSETQPMEGSDLLFTCKASGTPKPSLIWSRQRKPGSPTQSLVEVNGEFNDSTFYKKNATPGDSGLYYCYAVNDAGNSTEHLEVTVRGKPHLHVEKSVINSDIGIQTVLKCSSLYEPIHISWYKDGQIASSLYKQYPVESREGAYGTETTLTVTPDGDDDFGTFSCQALNGYGSDSKPIELVQRPVVENLHSQGLTLTWTVHSYQPIENIVVTLKEVGGDEEINYDVPLPESANKPTYELIYILNEANLSGKTYEATVRVKNNKEWSLPSETAIVKIDEHHRIQAASNKPRIHVHRPVINSDIGIEAVLKCSTHEEPNQITWYKDDRDITYYNKDYRVESRQGTNSTDSTLTVIPNSDDDFGTFTCEARNIYGSHRKSIELVQRPVVESLGSQGPKLTWTVHSHQPLKAIEVYLQQIGEDGVGLSYSVPLPATSGNKTHTYDFTYVLDDEEKLQGKTYEATVKVENDKEWSLPSEPAIVKIDSLAQSIQTASVLSGLSGDAAHSIRPSSFVLNSIMMYLLVRML